MSSATLCDPITEHYELRERMHDPAFRSAVRRFLWSRGDLRYLLRQNGQSRVYDFMKARSGSSAPIMAMCHRRLGKTFAGLTAAVERCISKQGHIAKFAAPSREQGESIVVPNLQILLRDCPEDLRPTRKGNTYYFSNPEWDAPDEQSTLEIHGANYKKGDALRGMACDTWILDEIREFDHLEYLMTDIIAYQVADRPDPMLVMLSTPPRSMDHDMIAMFLPRARRASRYLVVPASSNEDWTEREDGAVLEACGSKESISYRREAECELVSDEESLILPEWQHVEDELVVAHPRPVCFIPSVVIDMGWTDFTAVGFWYVDFERQLNILEDELVVHNVCTGDLAAEIKARIKHLWGSYEGATEPRIFADAPMITIQDMRRHWGLKVQEVEKHDQEASLATFRTAVMQKKIRVNPRCTEHIYQFRNGIWNEKRSDFIRSPRLGHCDCIAESVYAHRMAKWNRNPFPEVKSDIDTREKHIRPQRAAIRRSGYSVITKALCRSEAS